MAGPGRWQENAALHAALVTANAGSHAGVSPDGNAMLEALAAAQVDVERANQRSQKLEAALAWMARGGSGAEQHVAGERTGGEAGAAAAGAGLGAGAGAGVGVGVAAEAGAVMGGQRGRGRRRRD